MRHGQYAGEIVFDPEAITVLVDAVMEAGTGCVVSGSECVRPAYARVMREVVASAHYCDGERGTSDPKELADGAVAVPCSELSYRPQTETQLAARISADDVISPPLGPP